MLSESPAVGSGHGHRRGRTSAAPPGMDWTCQWAPAPWTPPPNPTGRQDPQLLPPPHGAARELLPAQEDGWTDGRRLRGQAERGSSSSGTAQRAAPSSSPSPAPRGRGTDAAFQAGPRASAPAVASPVRCDSSFRTSLYFLSSCVVVIMFYFLISCSPDVEETGSL